MIEDKFLSRDFWKIEENYGPDDIVLISDSGETYQARELGKSITEKSKKIKVELEKVGHKKNKALACILTSNQAEDIICYLTSLRDNHAAILLDQKTNPNLLKDILEIYYPEWIGAAGLDDDQAEVLAELGYERHESLWILAQANKGAREIIEESGHIYPTTGVLLSTSGTTGSPKMVRLTRANVQANAASIAQYLEQDKSDRPITSLPMSYSYGLSVINSHLLVGATILLTNESFMSKSCWDFFRQEEATSMAGVPYNYQMLKRLGLDKMELPSLKKLTQAGGRLSEDLIDYFHKLSQDKGWKFSVMYGQTEATARMSYVPVDKLGDKIGSIGLAIPGGEFFINPETGELSYRGPNVMLGYAESRSDLAKGDELDGLLHTGDLARQDEDGYFYITGRMKRFLKIFGLRVNLDQVEKTLQAEFGPHPACTGRDDLLMVFYDSPVDVKEVGKWLSKEYKFHHTAYKIQVIDEIPKTLNGKLDYSSLLKRLED